MNDLFEIAKSGLLAAQQKSTVTANNIANADTPGYSQERVNLEPVFYNRNGVSTGLGVKTGDVVRVRDNLVDKQLQTKNSELGGLNTKSKIYGELQSLMITNSGNDLDKNITSFFNSFSDLANNPQDNSLRNAVLSNAKTLVDKFHSLSSGMDQIQQATQTDVGGIVTKINSILQDLAQTNTSIAQSNDINKSDNTSKDLQTQKLSDLSKLVNFTTSTDQTGALEIRIGGMIVLDGSHASTINQGATDPGGKINIRLNSGKLLDVQDGQLAADIKMANDVIPGLKDQLNNLASKIVKEVNQVHSAGYGLADNVQRNFFESTKTLASNIQINQDILNNPENIAASSVAGQAGNNQNALNMVNLRNKAVINGENFYQSALSLISSPGTTLSTIKSDIQTKQSAQQMLQNQQDSVSGVNIDEELSKMIKFQNAYQASAKVIVAGKQMFDALLNTIQ